LTCPPTILIVFSVMNTTLALQVIAKIISGMFFTPEMVIILSIVAVAGIAFWIKARLNA